jgi:hypothetical protein
MPLPKQLQALLAGLGLGGEFTLLIRHAVQEDWSETEFLTALTKSNQFQKKFPGLLTGSGDLQSFLTGGSGVISSSNLGKAISNYYSLQNSYEQSLRGTAFDLTGDRMAMLIRNQVSPDEFARKAFAIQSIKSNPGLKEAYNAVLIANGMKPLDERGLFKLAAGTLDQKFYDIYEAAQLAGTALPGGATLDAVSAYRVAQGIGAPGQLANIGDVIKELRGNLAEVGPELRANGITTEDLALLAGGNDPRGIEQTVRGILQSRRTLASGYVPNQQLSTRGGVSYGNYDQQSVAAE